MDSFLDLQNFSPPHNLTFPDFDQVQPESENMDSAIDSRQYHEEFNQDGKKSHRCTFPGCGKIFKYKSEITRHLVIHFPERSYMCPHENCKKAFKRADALENHVRIHTNDLPFKCDHPDCGLKFVTKAALRYHMLKHNNDRTFVCSFPGCRKSFLTKTQLKQHERAENYHLKVAAFTSTFPTETVEPVKKHKSEEIVSKDICANIGPAPRLAKSLAWEVKNVEEPIEEPVQVKGDGKLEGMLRQMLEENRMLKEKLDVCTRIMDIFNENQEMRTKLPKSPEGKSPVDFRFDFGSQNQPNFSMEESEFRFLNF